jgi:hypothetical protein
MITVNLSQTTKILKKIPRYMIKRLNFVKVIFTVETTSEKLLRIFEFT